MSAPRLSFIVPVHNTAPWLERCLGSLLQNDFADLEVVAIDDGSTDGSLDILLRWAAKDSRLKIQRHASQKGPGRTRNTGLQAVSGETIGFVDSDDWLDIRVYRNLHGRMTDTGADMGACSVRLEDPNGKRTGAWRMPDQLIPLDSAGNVQAAYRILHDSCANKLFRRELLADLEFPRIYYEDGPFVIEAFCRAKSIVFVPDEGYHYITRPRSIMQSAPDSARIQSAVESMALAWESLSRRGIADRVRGRYDIRVRWLLRLAVVGLVGLERETRDKLWREVQTLVPPVWDDIMPFRAWERKLYLSLLRRPSPAPLARALKITVDTAATLARWVTHVRCPFIKESS